VALCFFLATGLFVIEGFSWSNGGYSNNPSSPDYGTHDWIAQHALDWLPSKEKTFILNNIAVYLYGTELPDNGKVPDGIGDIGKHHVYFYANESLQDDSSAIRAQQEFDIAVSFYLADDVYNAVKKLGIMTHYISDVAVFGHVMGSSTDWGNEIHHSEYETYVNARTDNYTDEFNIYLEFDGSLELISAYNATLELAYDTTFDVDGNLTCVWMDSHYNWSDTRFRNRCGKSLNLAVNLVADVLHTFYLEVQKHSEHFIDVPFYYQENSYYCGPAALQMVFDFWGELVSQNEIADVARTVPYVTYTDELRRAAHFSILSNSTGSEMIGSIKGYSVRKLGYAAYEISGLTLEGLKRLITEDYPLILLMRWIPGLTYGHYRVVTGYNTTHIFLHDPWLGSGGGPNTAMNYTFFLDMWAYSGYWALFVSPWKVTLEFPEEAYTWQKFIVKANITYVSPASYLNPDDAYSIYNYSASSCNATILLPEGVLLLQNETLVKPVGVIESGEGVQVSWSLKAVESGNYNITIVANGKIEGFVGGKPEVGPSYYYMDAIGGKGLGFVHVASDDFSPKIENPIQQPESNSVLPMQNVTILVNVTDGESGVKNVSLLYSINGSKWMSKPMKFNHTLSMYTTSIIGYPAGTEVRYMILAFDNAENQATADNNGIYYVYQVVPEFLLLLIFTTLALVTLILALSKIKSKTS
jgi:hypothetical protein